MDVEMLTTASITCAARSERSIAWRAAAGDATVRQRARLTPKARAKEQVFGLHATVEATETARKVFMFRHSVFHRPQFMLADLRKRSCLHLIESRGQFIRRYWRLLRPSLNDLVGLAFALAALR